MAKWLRVCLWLALAVLMVFADKVAVSHEGGAVVMPPPPVYIDFDKMIAQDTQTTPSHG